MKDPVDIPCWQRIDSRLTTSGRLDPADPGRLAALGITYVINLALADSPGALVDEAERMASAGITYVHIPVPFDAPADDHFAQFEKAMAEAGDARIHVHCIMNWRVSAFIYRHNRLRGMDEVPARALLNKQWDPAISLHKDAPAWARFINNA